jgi:hypothetical protein
MFRTVRMGKGESMSEIQPADVGIRIAAGSDTPIAWLTMAAKLAAEYMVKVRYGLKDYLKCGERFKAISGELFSGYGDLELCVGRVKDNEHAHLMGSYYADERHNIVDATIYLVRV